MIARIVISFLTVFCGISASSAQTPDAFVELVKGTAWVRSTKDSKPTRLSEKTSLFSGQRVICSRGCKELTISYCNRTIKVDVPQNPNGKLIVGINCNSAKGVRGGGIKGESSLILSPKESERIQPETFKVQWNSQIFSTPAGLSLRIYLGETIWGPKKVYGTKGSYQSPSLTSALIKSQNSGQLILSLTLDDGKRPKQTVKFYVISEEDEKNLRRLLLRASESETDRMLRAVGRGAAFAEYGIYTQATEEFEVAIRIAYRRKGEQSTLAKLQSLVIESNYMAYNDDRVKELCRSWQFSSALLPEACSLIQ